MNKVEKDKKLRRETKILIIEAMGGACVCCGYKECAAALALHHLNPEEKDFNLKSVRRTKKSWPSIVEELRKCVLVCSNCHAEIHAGIKKVSKRAKKFNEKFAEFYINII